MRHIEAAAQMLSQRFSGDPKRAADASGLLWRRTAIAPLGLIYFPPGRGERYGLACLDASIPPKSARRFLSIALGHFTRGHRSELAFAYECSGAARFGEVSADAAREAALFADVFLHGARAARESAPAVRRARDEEARR